MQCLGSHFFVAHLQTLHHQPSTFSATLVLAFLNATVILSVKMVRRLHIVLKSDESLFLLRLDYINLRYYVSSFGHLY
jgi:hypothetical protein